MTVGIEAAQLQSALAKLAEAGGTQSQTPAELANKFQSLMQRTELVPPNASGQGGMETASKVLSQQDAELERVSNDANSFETASLTMSMEEVSAAGIKLMMEMSTAQIDLQAKMGVVESSKSSIETLMKSQ